MNFVPADRDPASPIIGTYGPPLLIAAIFGLFTWIVIYLLIQTF